METTNQVLTRVANEIEDKCGIKNSAFILSIILLLIDPVTWEVDKSYLTRIYHAIDIVEKDEELKKLLSKQKVNSK